MLKMFKALTL